MSATLTGKLGAWDLEWLSVPRGLQGQARVRISGKEYPVSWRKDPQGVWVEFSHGVFGFDLLAEKDEDGKITYRLKSRQGVEHAVG
ncbi:MAG: hypothetical protein ACK5QT_03700, partial [Oligoflexia bacterium]